MDELHNLIEEKDVDSVVFPAIDYDEDTGTYNKHEYFSMSELFGLVANTVVDWKDLGNLIFKISVTPWSKLYKHEIIKKCQARFPLNLIYHDNRFFGKCCSILKGFTFMTGFSILEGFIPLHAPIPMMSEI